MLFISEDRVKEIGIDWEATIMVIENAVRCIIEKDYVQPVKPYLRFRDMKNRIIAMPAFVGGSIDMAGIKWISSFPQNINRGVPRAHSVIILNNTTTGEPLSIITTALLSIIRTASVSGMVIKHYNAARKLRRVNIGIIGFGPIGQYHLKMCLACLKDQIANIFLYDVRPINDSCVPQDNTLIQIVNSWEEAYINSDILITCTVSDAPYIDKMPKAGSLHLNVSLRDYKTDTYEWFKDSIIVDDWDEVCREKTDIQMMHIEKGLQQERIKTIADIVEGDCLKAYNHSLPIMFNPMGLAVFDIALGSYYYNREKCMNDKNAGL